jgi:hypothetical protein
MGADAGEEGVEILNRHRASAIAAILQTSRGTGA